MSRSFLRALQRIADDLAHRRVALGDIWDIDGKRAYLDTLEGEGLLPTASHTLSKSKLSTPAATTLPPRSTTVLAPVRRVNSIPETDTAWLGRAVLNDSEVFGKNCSFT